MLLTVAIVGLGALLTSALGVNGLQSSDIYAHGVMVLLLVGLYGATHGIDLREARMHVKLIVAAVTVGVVCKAVIIGTALWLATNNTDFFLFGIAIAQIDPLSVAALDRPGRLSSKAKSILHAWAAFDDPITSVLVVLTAGLFLSHPAGWDVVGGADLGPKLLVLLVATAGLFIRPPITRYLSILTKLALGAAALLLGSMLTEGIDLGLGVLLGTAGYLAQVIVGIGLTRRLPSSDRWRLACAQQNGVTAIVLALLLEQRVDSAVAVIGPAIITTNVIHAVVNYALDRRFVKQDPSQEIREMATV